MVNKREDWADYLLKISEAAENNAASDYANTNISLKQELVEQQHTEHLLSEQKARLNQQIDFTNVITSSMEEGIYVIDDVGHVTFLNPAAETLLGWRKEELMGQSIHDKIHAHQADGMDFPNAACPLLDVLEKGISIHDQESSFIHRNGTLFPVIFTMSPLLTNGEISGAVLAFRNPEMTARQRE